MADVVRPEVRSRMMSGIKGKDTKPEVYVRKMLHAAGFGYRLHHRKLPGKPDIVLSKYRAVIFVHGCFWHGHRCHLFKLPSTRTEFWRQKISANADRDVVANQKLLDSQWRVATVWECAIKGKKRLQPAEIESVLVNWLRSESGKLEVTGRPGD
ncbi:very short patch repair endonuclease [Roseibium aquae]|uniref:very short patch repair endonuclease n=1 Tax=Roseibium aquae TaxID=1323746 RepID=UPI00123D1249|nr:very short patch repair endonuclease [Roseibium aquae]